MISHDGKLLRLCQELLPELETDKCEMDAIERLLYDKYFAAIVRTCAEFNKQLQPTAPSDTFIASLKQRTNQQQHIEPTEADIWIFGYGSLMWKADFPYIDRQQGFICGYKRRFYQNSIDHRGTHQKPGRVVTLLKSDNAADRTYGVAYRIAARHKDEVLAHLDYREKNGYERCMLEFQAFPEELAKQCTVIMYIATAENDSYAGDVWQLEKIAEQIISSAGPSGPNREYLFHLADTMRALFPGAEDEHLYDLEAAVRERLQKDEAVLLERAIKRDIHDILCSDSNGLSCCADTIQELVLRSELPGWKEMLLARELQGQ